MTLTKNVPWESSMGYGIHLKQHANTQVPEEEEGVAKMPRKCCWKQLIYMSKSPNPGASKEKEQRGTRRLRT